MLFPDKERCTAKSRETGERCKNLPISGGFVCWHHGGMRRNVRAKANERLRLRKMEELLVEMTKDAPPMEHVGDVYAELLAVAGQAALWRKILSQRVSDLTELGYRGVAAEQIKADVQLFERALDRSAKIGEMIARLNLDERKAAIDERTAASVASALQEVLANMELTPAQTAKAAKLIPKAMRELTTR